MYNPYLNQYYGTQQMNRPQPMEMPMQQQTPPQMGLNRAFLNGKQVDSIDVVKATDISLDGSVNYFPLIDGSAIITKQLQRDGTSKITIYEPKQEKQTIKYVTMDDLKEKIEDFSDLESQLEDLRKEIKEIKSKLKPKKEE